jgi:hypothetical protein
MYQFTVPQFIEHKAKIIGPLTFQQFIYVGIAGALAFFLYFTSPLPVFLLGTVVLGGVSSALAFVKIEGRSLPETLKNFLSFSSSPKLYLWKKKVGPPPKLVKEERETPALINKSPVPTIVGKSHLKDLFNQIETTEEK